MPVVTKDATSGWWIPQSASEWTSLLAGRLTAYTGPTQLWLMQEASGSLADSIGTATLTASGSVAYQQTVTGWSRKAVVPTAGGANYWVNNTDTGLSTGDGVVTLLVIAAITALPAADRDVALIGDGQGHKLMATASGGVTVEKYVVSGVSATGTADLGTSVRPWVFSRDSGITPTYNKLQSDVETVVPAATRCLSSTKQIFFGGVVEVAPAIQYLYACQFVGITYDDTGRATLIDCLKNGPAITSIAISPSTATIAPAATQAMVATSTRADTSTVVNTGSCTWSSASPSIATVNASTGVVTGVSGGTAVITCTFTSLNAAAATSNTSVITVSAGAGATVPLPVVGVDVPDHIALALARLPEQDKNKTNIAALVNVCVSPTVALESALWQLLTQRRVTTAIGSQLDALGKLVGQPRNGLSDADYQTYIAARISANRSSGLIEDLLRVAKTLINNTAAVITASYGGAGTVIVTITGITRTTAQGAALAAFEQAAVAAGIRVVVAYSTSVIGSTFRYDVGPGYDVGHYADGIG